MSAQSNSDHKHGDHRSNCFAENPENSRVAAHESIGHGGTARGSLLCTPDISLEISMPIPH